MITITDSNMKTTFKRSNNQGSILVIGLILLAALLLISGVFLYKHQQNNKAIAAERAQYAQAEKDMDALVAQITAKFGKPDNSKKVKSCGYTSVEFGRGDRYCGISIAIAYPILSREAATQLSEEISSHIKSSSTFEYGSSSKALANTSITPIELKSESFRDRDGLDCGASYTYSLASDSAAAYAGIRSKAAQTLSLSMSCGSRPAKSAYYPIS